MDVTPVLQDDGPDPICPIAYNPHYTDTMNYFRAFLLSQEKSRRALWVTHDAIDFNPSNYTAFHYRRAILEEIGGWDKELEYITNLIKRNIKNYQVWHHRRCVIEKLGDPSKELDFIALMLLKDSKNYHAWSYRQWVIKTYNLFEHELEYIDELLDFDIRNNSAWNQRYFVIENTTDLSIDVRKQEIQYAFRRIAMSPNNISSWNYLKGMVKGMKWSDFPEVEEFCMGYETRLFTCANLFSLLIDIYQEKGDLTHLNQCIEYCDILSSGIDDIHKKYWINRKKHLSAKLKDLEEL